MYVQFVYNNFNVLIFNLLQNFSDRFFIPEKLP